MEKTELNLEEGLGARSWRASLGARAREREHTHTHTYARSLPPPFARAPARRSSRVQRGRGQQRPEHDQLCEPLQRWAWQAGGRSLRCVGFRALHARLQPGSRHKAQARRSPRRCVRNECRGGAVPLCRASDSSLVVQATPFTQSKARPCFTCRTRASTKCLQKRAAVPLSCAPCFSAPRTTRLRASSVKRSSSTAASSLFSSCTSSFTFPTRSTSRARCSSPCCTAANARWDGFALRAHPPALRLTHC